MARTSLASETLRGLGYWFFYGVDKLGLYLPMAGPYMTSLWLLAVSFAVPAVAFLAAFVVRWRERAYFVVLVLVGTVLAVGVHPLSDPSPLGRAGEGQRARGRRWGWRCAAPTGPRRSSCWASAVLLGGRCRRVGATVEGGGRDRRPWPWPGSSPPTCPALWTGQFVARPTVAAREQIPSYWTEAADVSRQPARRGADAACSPSPASTSPPTGGGSPSIRCCPAS